ncbi:hypothetical protein GQ44DRAFT_694239 [Phaeosphaeriaceae sp. PMI808]|nr:hypothetical protein GQ44DRAFT_694239 [Phaeosphaeriaceae sp. PMI808]
MLATRSRYARRDDKSDFDPKRFYRFGNSILANNTLSAGAFADSKGVVSMAQTGSFSSENWQIFSQSGRYFIRNYDFGAKMQLGMSEDNINVKMYLRNGSLQQQWLINKVDGGWELVNGLLGPGTTLILPSGWKAPVMRSDNQGGVWNITENASAAESKPLTGDWANPAENFQVPTPTPSATPSASSITSLVSVTPASAGPAPPASTSTLPPPSPPSSLPTGAIAGIAIGGVALVSVILALWFCYFKKRKTPKYNNVHEVQGMSLQGEMQGTPVVTEKYGYRAELDVSPAELSTNGREGIAELDSSSSVTPLKST